jgi:superfamily I DNA/RNA helicase
MQLSLVRKWGERANYFIVAGDDDQTIFSFTGATPEAFLDPDVPADHKIILKQSYRVPRAVHRFAEDLIRRVSRRQPKEYLPRPEDGALERFARDGYKRTETAIIPDALKHIEQGKTLMFLGSCSYMLRPLIQVLRKQGIPFHNPHRKSNGFWNPLRTGKPGSTAARILSLLVGHPDFGEDHCQWSMGDVAQWAEWLQAKGILRHGIKSKLKTCDVAQPATVERLNDIFEPEALDSLMGAWDSGYRELLEWWRARVTADVGKRVQFPAEIAAKRGPRALLQAPQVVVGTIHSVKGGQADAVYLFPDFSQAGDAQYRRGGAQRDSAIRLFYVGATRAREKLYICARESSIAMSI